MRLPNPEHFSWKLSLFLGILAHCLLTYNTPSSKIARKDEVYGGKSQTGHEITWIL